MKCPTCGTINKENYCIKCGTLIMKDGTIGKINTEEKKNIYDDLELFVGKNTEKILHKGFNYSAAFFTPVYFLYRKCFWEGTILLILEYFLMLLYLTIANGPLLYMPNEFHLWIIGFLFITRIIIFGSTFNSYYLYRCKNKIKKLTFHDNNKGAIFQKYGGTSFLAPTLIPTIFYLIIIICMYIGIRIM